MLRLPRNPALFPDFVVPADGARIGAELAGRNPALFPTSSCSAASPSRPTASFPDAPRLSAALAQAVPQRKIEFAAGRYRARPALATFVPSLSDSVNDIAPDRGPR